MQRNDNLFFIDKEKEWENFGEGIVRKIMGYDENLMMVKVKFNKGASVPSHSHPHTQNSIIETGRFELYIGKDHRILEKGDGFFVPSGVAHKAVAIKGGIIVDTFHPAREDFII